jgi:hypothetical protein
MDCSRWLGSGYDYQPLEEGYVGKCHLCVDVRRWLVTQGGFPELCRRSSMIISERCPFYGKGQLEHMASG